MDPAAFGGRVAFERQTEWLARACRSSEPRPGVDRVRLPGDRALARKHSALADGVVPYADIMDALRPFAERFGIQMPNVL